MSLEFEYKVHYCGGGQSGPYSPTRTTWRIERWESRVAHHEVTMVLAYPTKWDGDKYVRSPESMMEIVKALFPTIRSKEEVGSGIDEHFKGYSEVFFPQDGVIEVMFVRPFTD